MKIIENKSELKDFLTQIRKKGHKIGLIPTMGSIHEGHLSLIRASKKLGYYCLVTIFVNPTQFDKYDDFNKYPRDYIKDKNNLEDSPTDLLFLPSTDDIYPNGIKSEKTVHDYRGILCDNYRNGHFDGVTTVVNSLFNLINPEYVFFGEKDFQQLKIVQKVIENNKYSIVMYPCSSVRMSNGMSFSSRYKNFSIEEKKIFQISANILIKFINDLKKNFDLKILEDLKIKLKNNELIKIDYVEIKNEIDLMPAFEKNNSRLFVAFHIGKIRVIDNFILY